MFLRVNSVRFNTQDVVSYMLRLSLRVRASFSEMVLYVVALFIHLHLRTGVFREFAEVGPLLFFCFVSWLFIVNAALAYFIDFVVFCVADILFVSLVFFLLFAFTAPLHFSRRRGPSSGTTWTRRP